MTRHLHQVPDPDPFTPEDGYSPDKFVTTASDEKGHSERIRINLRTDLMPTIGQIVASGQFEAYRSSHDFIRDAVYHRLQYVADTLGLVNRNGKLEGKIHHVVTSAARVASIQEQEYQCERRVEYVTALCAQIEACRRRRDQTALRLAVSEAEEYLDDGWLYEPYRSQVQEILAKARQEIW